MAMKRIALLASLLLGLALTGCPSGSDEVGTSTAHAEEATVYECPMHCVPEGATDEYTAEAPGACPVCGMDLVERE